MGHGHDPDDRPPGVDHGGVRTGPVVEHLRLGRPHTDAVASPHPRSTPRSPGPGACRP
ncbi:hypothetical protein SGPA1_40955 [Streptomyces misionensis JCM 4497]